MKRKSKQADDSAALLYCNNAVIFVGRITEENGSWFNSWSVEKHERAQNNKR